MIGMIETQSRVTGAGASGGGRRWTHWKSHLAFMAVPSISSIQLHPRRDRMEGEGGRRRSIRGGWSWVVAGGENGSKATSSLPFLPPLPPPPSVTHTHTPQSNATLHRFLSPLYLLYIYFIAFFFHFFFITCALWRVADASITPPWISRAKWSGAATPPVPTTPPAPSKSRNKSQSRPPRFDPNQLIFSLALTNNFPSPSSPTFSSSFSSSSFWDYSEYNSK